MKAVAAGVLVASQLFSGFVFADIKCIMHEETSSGAGNYALTFTDASCLNNYVQQQTADIKKAVADNSDNIDKKADLTYVNTKLDAKADITSVNAQVNIKADKAYVDEKLNTKADITNVNTQINAKADKSYVDAQFAAKADKSYVDTQLKTKAAALDVKTNQQNIADNLYNFRRTLSLIPGMLEIEYKGNIVNGLCHGHTIGLAEITHANNARNLAGSAFTPVGDADIKHSPLNNPSFVFLAKADTSNVLPEGVAITTTPDSNNRDHKFEAVIRYDGGIAGQTMTPFIYDFWNSPGQGFWYFMPNGGLSVCIDNNQCSLLNSPITLDPLTFYKATTNDFTLQWVLPDSIAPYWHVDFTCT